MGYGAILGQVPRVEEALAAYDKTVKATYPIASGTTVSAGDVVDVVDALAPVMKPLSEFAEGDVVQLNENGVPVDFYVAKHNYESGLNGAGRTLLVRKDCYDSRQWNSSNVNAYATSTIDSWLNSTYKNLLDANVQTGMGTTKFKYTPGNGNNTVGTLERGVFLLSLTELGRSESYANTEGTVLSIASSLQIAYLNGSTVAQWTRSPRTDYTDAAAGLDINGNVVSYTCISANGSRPAFTLPATFKIQVGVDPSGAKEVVRNVVAEPNVENVFVSSAISGTDICKLNDDVSVAAYVSSNALIVGLIDNQIGKLISFQSTSMSGATNPKIIRLSDTQFVVGAFFGNPFNVWVCSVTGNTITLGTQGTIGTPKSADLLPISSNTFIDVVGGTGSLALTLVTYSSGSYTTSDIGILSELNLNPINISAIWLPDDSSGNKRVCVCFSDTGDHNKGKAVIATIDSSNAVTWGDVVEFNSASTYLISCAANGNTVVVSYSLDNNFAACRVLVVSETSITVGSQTSLLQSAFGNQTRTICVGGKFVVCGYGVSASGGVTGSHASVLNVSGSSVTVNTEYKFDPASAFYLNASPISDNRFIVAYADNGNSNYGTATILEVNGDQIAGSFTGNSTQAIALQSGTAGQSIEVIFAGTTAADFVAEGQKIPSDGVYGYGPMNGWLNVIPYWAKDAGVRIATGSYVGTGTYGQSNPNSLTFGFEPKMVWVCATNTSNASKEQATFLFGASFYSYVQASSASSNGSVTFGTSVQFNGNVMSWYSDNAIKQFNTNGTTYHFVAIG